MLTGIHPLLTGPLLAHLDAMGHSDAVVLADAHFPAERLATRSLVFPGVTTPDLLAAVRTVVPLDDAPALDLMASAYLVVRTGETRVYGNVILRKGVVRA